jgi:GNAT superfamily N-acetyltransferase
LERSRPATDVDVPRVAELARLLRSELTELRGGPLWADREAPGEPLADVIMGWLADPRRLVVVGAIDDVVIGYGTVAVETLRTGAALGVIDELFVEPGARSVGVGEAMAGELVAFCDEHHCSGIDARALPGHRAAKNFFETNGFTARAIVMHQNRPSAAS